MLPPREADGVRIWTGPGPCDDDALVAWLRAGCTTLPPVRQGFALVVTAPDGSLLAATSNRAEIALFHTLDAGRLLVEAHPRDLIVGMAAPPSLDVEVLADLLALHDRPHTTPFVGVSRLPLGHLLRWRPGSAPQVSRWFRPESQPRLRVDQATAVAMMREAVLDSVAMSLPPSGDVAATLSGGLDSSMVVASAAHLLGPAARSVHAVTHVPRAGTVDERPLWEADDGPYAERTARALPGVTWRPLVNEPPVTPLASALAGFARSWMPNPVSANVVWMTAALEHAAAVASPLLLTGATGNAQFSRGRTGVVHELARSGRLPALARYAGARHRSGRSWRSIARETAREVVPDRVHDLPVLRARRPGRREDWFLRQTPIRTDSLSPTGTAAASALGVPHRATRASWVEEVLYDSPTALTLQLLRDDVWYSDPLSDPHIISLALRLPADAWVVGGVGRGLARASSEGLVPDEIRQRTTRGTQGADVGSWLDGQEAEYLAAFEAINRSPAASSFVDVTRLQAGLGDGFPQGWDRLRSTRWDNTWGRAFSLGSFAAWYETEVLGRSPLR